MVLDRRLLIESDAIVILMMDGIFKSKGVMAEVMIADAINLPIYYYEAKTHTLTRKTIDEVMLDFIEREDEE